MGSNIFLAACIELVITTIFEISEDEVAWFIPHLIAKSLASIILKFTMWWSILTIGLSWIWTWVMEVATLFLILVFIMISAWVGFSKEEIAKLSNWQKQEERLFSLHLLKKLKKKD